MTPCLFIAPSVTVVTKVWVSTKLIHPILLLLAAGRLI
jgi:hypothetical protein